MTPAQQKYLKERLGRIRQSKLNKIQKVYETKYHTLEERLEALKTGAFKIREKPKNANSWGQSLEDFIEYEGVVDNSEILKEKATEINNEYELVMDQVMLGGEDGVLAAIQSFEAKEF